MKGVSGQIFHFVMSFAVAALCGCNSTTGFLPVASQRGVPGVLPSIEGLDRLASETGLETSYANLASPIMELNTTYVEPDRGFSAPPQGIAYAVFRFEPGDNSLLSLKAEGKHGLWFCVANYSSRRWSAAREVSPEVAQITFDTEVDWVSPAGYVYAAVIASPGISSLLNKMWLEQVSSDHQPTTYYVATSGSDENTGSISEPWRTIQHATETILPGDTVIVSHGQYASFSIEVIGTEELPCKLIGEPGARILTSASETAYGMNIEACTHLTVEGFEVSGPFQWSIRVSNSSNVKISRNEVQASEAASIDISNCRMLKITGNKFFNTITGPSLRVYGENQNLFINNNEWIGVSNACIDVRGGFVLGTHGQTSILKISENNMSSNSPSLLYQSKFSAVVDCTIVNNLLVFGYGRAIYIDDAGPGLESSGTVIANNTFVGSEGSLACLKLADGCGDVSVYNNIICGPDNLPAYELNSGTWSLLSSNNNVLTDRFKNGIDQMSLLEWQAFSGQDSHSQVATPDLSFQDYSAGDYRPAGPALDSALMQFAPEFDILGNVRPFGAGYDRGCYELLELPAE